MTERIEGAAEHVEIRRGAYYDSVALMRVSRSLSALGGVEEAVVAMATELNVELAAGMGFEVPADAGPSDLLVALRGDDLGAARAELDRLLVTTEENGDREDAAPRTVRSAAATATSGKGPALALISVPGEHAFAEALDAVEAGLPVMIFSDNVSLGHEVALKRRAVEKDVLVMGPDCGTAIVSGVGLGFANAVRRGPVGVVAASGTGAQQVSCLLELGGTGVSHVLGVGGRDLTPPVAGRSTLKALSMLDADPATEMIIVVSKPPDPEVARAVRRATEAATTPVMHALLDDADSDLTTVTEKALTALGVPVPVWPSWPARHGPARLGPVRRGALHGVFAGGTLCEEARRIAGTGTFTDFGDDAYTRGRAHPMIDPSLRVERITELAGSPHEHAGTEDTAVILLDVVLGYGADPNPAAALAPVIADARAAGVQVVAALIGTPGDPQGLERQAGALRAAGASVFVSCAAAARYARSLLGE